MSLSPAQWQSAVLTARDGLFTAWANLGMGNNPTPPVQQILLGIANIECGMNPGRPYNYGNVTCSGTNAAGSDCPPGCGKIGVDVVGNDLCYRDYASASAGIQDMVNTVINHKLANGQKTRALGFVLSGDALGTATAMFEAGYYSGDYNAHPNPTDRIQIYAQGIYASAQRIAPVLGQPLAVTMGPSIALPLAVAGSSGIIGLSVLAGATYWAIKKGVIR